MKRYKVIVTVQGCTPTTFDMTTRQARDEVIESIIKTFNQSQVKIETKEEDDCIDDRSTTCQQK